MSIVDLFCLLITLVLLSASVLWSSEIALSDADAKQIARAVGVA